MSDMWNEIYHAKAPEDRSWTQERALMSMEFVGRSEIAHAASIIDVGGGSSMFVDDLLADGYQDITVLDIASLAIDEARSRVAANPGDAERVRWLVADVLQWTPDRVYTLWHDRAVFHFLVEQRDREQYRRVMMQAVEPRGFAIIATFAPSGPDACSGLPVQRWSCAELAAAFGSEFSHIDETEQPHLTPWGASQPFSWVLLRRTS